MLKAAQKELIESELRYRRLFNTAHDGILIVDFTTSLIIDVNPFLLEFLGYSREEILGNSLWDTACSVSVSVARIDWSWGRSCSLVIRN